MKNKKKISYWNDTDFNENKSYWKNKPISENLEVRIQNLKILDKALKDADIFYFLEGNTLNFIYRYSKLDENDHDDDVGIFLKDKEKLLGLEKKLNKLGFVIIRNNNDMITVYRQKRYIDICLFRKSFFKIGYGKKYFQKKYFELFQQLDYEGIKFNIPTLTNEFLKVRYDKKS
ncbi:hypothetical protein N9H64_04620 [Acidimicrobiia bacterium]|nr:hypothetical protein [Acidimicrobiia bacterium]